MLVLWGQKQEVTPTFHSLLLPSGEWIEASEVMAETWRGTTPGGNHAPRISSLATRADPVRSQTAARSAQVAAHDPDGDPLAVEWSVLQESTDLKKAGDAETVPPDHSKSLKNRNGKTVEISHLPAGNYRRFVIVRDERGAAATGNLRFQVR